MDTLEAILYLERGPQPNLRFALAQELTTIGRGAGNELVLVDPEVSRRHARIIRQPHQYAVEDLGSTNGTFVNGQRVSSLTALQDADVIELGDTVRLRFVVTSPLPSSAAAAPGYTPVPVHEPVVDPTPAPSSPAPVVASVPAESSPPIPASPEFAYTPGPASVEAPARRSFWIGCGLFLALLLVCLGTFLLLDAFQGGRLLYCGPLRPLFEFVLGPFGFAPIC